MQPDRRDRRRNETKAEIKDAMALKNSKFAGVILLFLLYQHFRAISQSKQFKQSLTMNFSVKFPKRKTPCNKKIKWVHYNSFYEWRNL